MAAVILQIELWRAGVGVHIRKLKCFVFSYSEMYYIRFINHYRGMHYSSNVMQLINYLSFKCFSHPPSC